MRSNSIVSKIGAANCGHGAPATVVRGTALEVWLMCSLVCRGLELLLKRKCRRKRCGIGTTCRDCHLGLRSTAGLGE